MGSRNHPSRKRESHLGCTGQDDDSETNWKACERFAICACHAHAARVAEQQRNAGVMSYRILKQSRRKIALM